jgi:hypothetical protein
VGRFWKPAPALTILASLLALGSVIVVLGYTRPHKHASMACGRKEATFALVAYGQEDGDFGINPDGSLSTSSGPPVVRCEPPLLHQHPEIKN